MAECAFILVESMVLVASGLVTNYGEVGSTKREVGGGQDLVRFYLYEKGGGWKRFKPF